MQWRVRTTLADRPGMLAGIARACGLANVNILAMQAFSTSPMVTDSFVVAAPDGWVDLDVARLFESAGGDDVAVTRVGEDSALDSPTRYLEGVRQVIEDGRDVEDVLAELLETEPPDVADYAGHDVLDLRHRNGTALRISRAVPFTPVERTRAQALLALVGDAGADTPLIAPSPRHPVPLVREASLADLESVAALHSRCSVDTLYQRYRVPLPTSMTTRMARRLAQPPDGVALVIQVGLDIVGHGVLEQVDLGWTFQLLIEDAWAGRGLGSMLVKNAAGRAKGLGAQRLTFITGTSDDSLLRAVGGAGFVARVERHDDSVHITVPLGTVQAMAIS